MWPTSRTLPTGRRGIVVRQLSLLEDDDWDVIALQPGMLGVTLPAGQSHYKDVGTGGGGERRARRDPAG